LSEIAQITAAPEREIQHVARRLWEQMRGETPSAFRKDFWVGHLLDWSMRQPDLKVDLFRLVDVLPVLGSAKQIQQHVDEYLRTERQSMPKGLATVFKLAGGLPSVVTAKAVQKSVRELASRFIVAEDVSSALPRLRALNADGIGATVDLLGEVTLSYAEADAYYQRYHDLIVQLPAEMTRWPSVATLERNHLGSIPRANVSIKLSALEPHLDPVDSEGSVARLIDRVLPLLIDAAARDVFINLDMEQWAYHGITLAFLERALEHPALRAWPHIGVAVQAYAKAAGQDLERLLRLAQQRGAPITVRLVKGAYWDYEVVNARQHGFSCPVFEEKAATDANFENLSRFLLEHADDLIPAFGTHNLRSVAHALVQAEARDVPKEAFEFQVLYGMAEPLRSALRDNGYRVRVYAPVGELLPGMAYLVRRLLENTSNEGFLRMSYHDEANLDTLLAKPAPAAEPADALWPPPPNLDAPFQNSPHRDFTHDEEREAFAAAVRDVPSTFPIRVPVIVSGTRRDGGTTHGRVSPNDGRTRVADISMAGPELVEEAIQAAAKAFPAWRDTPVRARAMLLEKLAARLFEDRNRLAALQVHEVAKPWRDADGDVAEAIDFCRYYARRALEELSPQPLNRVPGEENVLLYEGRGPTAVIAPWNFPMAILCGMTTAALVSGNAVLMKPAEQSSATAYALFEHMLEAGFPPEVVQFVPGYGEEIGPVLVEHPLVAQVAFTGSKAVGLRILEQIGARRPGQALIKRAICEMGGKNAIIVDEDADLDEAVGGVIDSAFGYAGQKCSAGSRVIVVDRAYEPFLRRLVEACRSLRMAVAADPACQVPPVVDYEAHQRLLGELQAACSERPAAFCGATPPGDGYFVPPLVLEIQDVQHRLVQEELFGPILAVTRAESFEEAIALSAMSEYALTGAVFSRTPSHLELARAQFHVGNLYLNRGSTGAMVGRQPFGGFKMSGTDSKAGGPGYLIHFVDARCVTENTMRRGFTPDVML
jgi:RHH-type transcriptional regulator, proline utilization regulon repressor / proline dehydrogenase / delta 1-pyrroline-5-carboxylate dehydrogenase